MTDTSEFTLLSSDSSYQRGIFAGELLSAKDIEDIGEIELSLRQQIAGIRFFLQEIKEYSDIDISGIDDLAQKSLGGGIGVLTGGQDADNPTLQDFKNFCNHDYSQILDVNHAMRLSIECHFNDNPGSQIAYKKQKIDSYTAVLMCFENLLTVLNGEQSIETQYNASEIIQYLKDLLERRFINRSVGELKRGLEDAEGKSVYSPFTLHTHMPEDLMLPGSTGALLLMAMYNWAKNSITQGELRSKVYSYCKNPIYDAMGEMLGARVKENGGKIDVHMEIFETEEAMIGCVSDTGVGFDLNSIKAVLMSLTKDEESMTKFLQMGILSQDTFDALHEWKIDPRAFGRILGDLPSLIKMPRFSGASDEKLAQFGLAHSGIGLSSIEVAAREHYATTFITEHSKGGACMIMVIPKDPEKYRRTTTDITDKTRTNTGNALFQTPSHLLEKVA